MKQTEIGLIPDDWEVKTLGEIGEPCMCKRILKEQTSSTGDIPFYKIGTFGGIPDAYISRELFEQYKEQYNYPRKGTLLLSAAGTIGRVVVFDGKDSYFQDSNIVWIDNDETKVTNDFLFYCYSRMQWKTEEGGIVSRLYNANLKSTSFIAPKSLAEQQRIAKALSDVDALISTTEKLIQKKKDIKQGTMQNLLTGKKRLPGFGPQTKSPTYKQTELGPIPEDWEVKSLGELFEICTETISVDFIKKESYVGTENMLQDKMGVLKNETELNYLKLREYRKHDILVSNIRPYLKKIWFADKNGGCSTDVLVFRKKRNSDNAEFLFKIVSDDRFFNIVNDNAVGTKMPRGDKNIIKQILFAIPSIKEEQTAIANVLSSMDKEIETLNTKLEKYRNLKTAMMQQLLTGKIRLVK